MPIDLNQIGLLLGGLNPRGGGSFLRGYTRAQQEREQREAAKAQQRRQDELLRLQQQQEDRAQEAADAARQQQQMTGLNTIRQLLQDPDIDDPTAFHERLTFAKQFAPQLGIDPGFIESLRPPPDTFTKRALTKRLNDLDRLNDAERGTFEQTGVWAIGGQTYTPAQARQIVSGAQASTGQPLALNPQAKQSSTPAPGSYEEYVAATPERRREIEAARKGYYQAEDRTPAPPNTGVQDQRRFNMEQRLVSQWDKANAPMKEMRRQLGLMETGLTRFRSGDKNGGAQAVLVTFQKILDPTSVVRESEYARTAAGQSLINRITGFAQRLEAGGAGLTDGEMAAMVTTAQDFLRGMDTFNAGLRRRISATAQEYQLDPRMIFDDAEPAPTSGPRPSPGGNPFRQGQ